MTLNGCRWCFIFFSSDNLTFIEGSSAIIVPTPVMIAELRARNFCTSILDSALLIHLLSPFANAVLPSRLIASLHLTNGRPSFMRISKPGFNSRACVSIKPLAVSMPASFNCCNPLPETSGFGSSIAATTLLIPESIKDSVQGDVRP